MRTGDPIKRIQTLGIAAAVIGAVGAAAGLFLAGPGPFFQAYLFAYLFWTSLTFGGLAVVLLQYLVGSEWGMVIQRPLEAAAKTLWLAAVLFIPIILGMRFLYPWMDPQIVAADPVIQHKSSFLNLPGFIIRSAIYFIILGLIAWLSMSWAGQPRFWSDPNLRRRMQRLSAVGLILFVLIMTLASVDWIMSLQPTWYSTIYGFLIITGQALGGMALAIALLPVMMGERKLAQFVIPRHIRDLGALLFTLVLFYAYIAFSQYLIIWAGNLPHEVTWYLARSGFWLFLFLVVIAIEFVLPFAVLLSLRAKRNLRLISALSLGVLTMRMLDYYWHVAPAFHPGSFPPTWWVDLALALAVGGLWLVGFAFHLGRTPLQLYAKPVPVELNEPDRKESTV